MRLSLLVPPGIGKYKFAEKIAAKHKLGIIDSNEILLREVNSGSDAGLDIKRQVDAGKPVSDENIIYVIKKTLNEDNEKNGFIMAGLPTAGLHAEVIDNSLEKNGKSFYGLVFLDIEYDQLMEALTGNLTCRSCKAVFNIYSSPPVMDGICDECGAKLYMRSDDREETISRRIREYQSFSGPLESYYKKRFYRTPASITGNIEPDIMYKEIEKTVTKLKRAGKARDRRKAA